MPKPLEPPKPVWTPRRTLRLLGGLVILAGAALGAKEVNSFLNHDPRFDLVCAPGQTTCASLEIRGAVYSSRARIYSIFAQDFGNSVFNIPLDERRRHLLAIDWVSAASVSRVWPNRLVVTVTERKPVAFAKLPVEESSAGFTNGFRMALIDADGVLLSIPPRVRFRLPVLSGVSERQSDADRKARVEAMHHLLDDLGPQSTQISEVNAANPVDMRIVASLDNQAVELWIGDQHFRTRYLNFLSYYSEIRKHSGDASVFDLRLDDRILAK